MESVLEWYDKEPVAGVVRLTFDEKPCQLLGQKVEPLAAKPGSIKKVDHEYVRQGTANIAIGLRRRSGYPARTSA